MVFVIARLIGLSLSPQPHPELWAAQTPMSTLHPLSHPAPGDGTTRCLVHLKQRT